MIKKNLLLVLILGISLNANSTKKYFDVDIDDGFRKITKDLMLNHPNIKTKEALLKAVKNEIDEQDSAYLPKLDLSFEKAKIYNVTNEPSDSIKTDSQSINLTLKWNIFNGYADKNQKKIKQTRYNSLSFDNKNNTNELLLSFVKAYFEVAKQKEKYQISNELVKEYETYLEKIKLKREHGMTSLLDYMSMKKRYTNSKINNKESYEKRYFDALYNLQKYIKINKDSNLIVVDKVDFDIDNYDLNSLIKIAKNSHPLLFQAKSEISLAKQQIAMEKKDYYPVVDFVASRDQRRADYKDSIKNEDVQSTTIKIQAKFNLYNGGKTKYLIRQKQNNYQAKEYELQSKIKYVSYGVKINYNEYIVLKSKYELILRNLEYSQKAYEASKYDFEFGKITQDSMIGQLESLIANKDTVIDFKYDTIIAKYKTLASIGILYKQFESRTKN
jgi:outer membrane protein TolC